jgi:hypothetical protein
MPKISKRFGSAFEKCLKLAKSIFLAEEAGAGRVFFNWYILGE